MEWAGDVSPALVFLVPELLIVETCSFPVKIYWDCNLGLSSVENMVKR